ncbi:hypothetical protein ES708_24951 [subsurface metagenome]
MEFALCLHIRSARSTPFVDGLQVRPYTKRSSLTRDYHHPYRRIIHGISHGVSQLTQEFNIKRIHFLWSVQGNCSHPLTALVVKNVFILFHSVIVSLLFFEIMVQTSVDPFSILVLSLFGSFLSVIYYQVGLSPFEYWFSLLVECPYPFVTVLRIGTN